jgi:hypothetical protein
LKSYGKYLSGWDGRGLVGLGEVWYGCFLLTELVMKFNIDVSNLQAGDIIEQENCEQIIGFQRAKKMYEFGFELMQLAEYVQANLWKIGKPLTVVSHKGSIRVLTHVEASEYNASRFDNAITKMRKCHKRLVAVDTNGFDAEAKGNHSLSIIKTSRVLTAIKSSRTEVVVAPHVSVVPRRTVIAGKS